MYLPAQFKVDDRALAARLVREHPFASLISVDDAGAPFVTYAPLHLVEHGEQWRLLGHVAKGNPHGSYLAQRPQALVTFLGPHAYLSPKVYPDRARVPTWNYLAVHCKVQAKLLPDAHDKERVLKSLIADHEPAYAAQWNGLEEGFQQRMLAGIVAFELTVTELECKFKLNQHRPEAHDATFAHYCSGTEGEQGLARWMSVLGLAPERPD